MRISDWSSDVCSSDLWAPPSPGCRCPPPAERSTDFRRHNGGAMTQLDETVNVRYMVDDVEAAVAFYTEHFGFELGLDAMPAFADVRRGNLRLLLSDPASSAGRPMSDGATPGPGGWNRIRSEEHTSELQSLMRI